MLKKNKNKILDDTDKDIINVETHLPNKYKLVDDDEYEIPRIQTRFESSGIL